MPEFILEKMDFIPEHLFEDFVNLFHVVLAAVLGGIVGMEREWQQKPAGFRTHMVISSACCVLIILGRIVTHDYGMLHPEEGVEYSADPIRVLHAIIVGVSFIGAGTILKNTGSAQILYLTTAATILLSASIGMAVALYQYVLAVGIVVLVLIINLAIRKIDRKINKESIESTDHNPRD